MLTRSAHQEPHGPPPTSFVRSTIDYGTTDIEVAKLPLTFNFLCSKDPILFVSSARRPSTNPECKLSICMSALDHASLRPHELGLQNPPLAPPAARQPPIPKRYPPAPSQVPLRNLTIISALILPHCMTSTAVQPLLCDNMTNILVPLSIGDVV